MKQGIRRSVSKEQQSLFLDLEREGYDVVLANSGHFKIRMTPERKDVLRKAGFDVEAAPCQVVRHATASDHRAMRNALSVLRRIGYTPKS